MRRNILLLVLLALVLVMWAALSQAEAQPIYVVQPDDRYAGYPRGIPIRWPTAWPNLQQCRDQEYYEPKDVHLFQYRTRVKIASVQTQKTDQCVWESTSSGWRWVLRPAGTKFAVDDQGRELFDDGSPVGKACGNPRIVSIPIVDQVVEQPPPPQVVQPPPAPVVLPPPPPSPETPVPPPPPPTAKESKLGLTWSAGMFDSAPMGTLIGNITNRSVCNFQGKMFDIGLAFGRSGKSFWRTTFEGFVVDDGSFTRYACDKGCDVTVVADGVKGWGGSIGRVQAFGPSRWRVQPAVLAHFSAGILTGQATRYVGPIGGLTYSVVEDVGPEELFGSKAYANGGVGVGLAAGLGHNSILTVIVGPEIPRGVTVRGGLTIFW